MRSEGWGLPRLGVGGPGPQEVCRWRQCPGEVGWREELQLGVSCLSPILCCHLVA